MLVAAVAAAAACSSAAAQRVYTVAGTGAAATGKNGGPATAAAINHPRGLAVLGGGAFAFAEPFGNTVRSVSGGGILGPLAGTGQPGFAGDGGPAGSAQLQFVHGVAVSAGGVVIADTNNNRIRLVAPNGRITTVAGTGERGFGGDGGPAALAKVNAPRGVATTPSGGILIPDSGNHRVRKVLLDGRIVTVAGNGEEGFGGDGGAATAARLRLPFAVAATPDGGFLVADAANNRIRYVSPGGQIRTVAGSGATGDFGDGGPAVAASLTPPQAVAVTPDGGFLITQPDSHRVRKVSAAGVITTVAGTGSRGSSGDGGSPLRARLNFPKAVAPTPDGGMLIADSSNNRVRFVAPSATSRLAVAVLGETVRARRRRLKLPYAATIAASLRVEVFRGGRRVLRFRARGRRGRASVRRRLALRRGSYWILLTARAGGRRVATDSARLRVR